MTGVPAAVGGMSAEVVDSNPYSRLMALQRMGVVPDYQRIRGVSVVIVGVGGVGSVAAEMLTRCGVGRLVLIDIDTVTLANMNRLFFTPSQAGMTKTDAAAATLKAINPDVDVVPHCVDVTLGPGYDLLRDIVAHGGLKSGSPVDLVLACVDNYGARIAINRVCTELNQPWMESGVSEDAVSGHIQLMLPGRTACFECVAPHIVASGVDERTLRREGVCAASLPTTMAIVSGMLVQNVLKFCLGFGQVSYLLRYSAMNNYFPSDIIRPNPECNNASCRTRQTEQTEAWKPQVWAPPHEDNSAPVHSDNEWEITVDDRADEEATADVAAPAVAAVAADEEDVSIEDLTAQLQAL